MDTNAYKVFSDIPKERQTREMAKSWLSAFPDKVRQIPRHLLDDAMLEESVSKFGWQIGCIEPEMTTIYEQLVINATFYVPSRINTLVESAISHDLALKVVKANPETWRYMVTDVKWEAIARSTEVVDAICSSSVTWAHTAFQWGCMGSDEAILAGIRQATLIGNLRPLKEMGRLPLLAAEISRGFWLEDLYKMSTTKVQKPLSLEQGIALLMASTDNAVKVMYTAYLMTFPVRDVVPAMSTGPRRKLLTEMYSSEDLLPFVGNNNELRGKILEVDLGL